MMSTWAASDPLRHPWFASASLKRKHSESSDEDIARDPDSDQDVASAFYPTPPPESAGVDSEFNERKRRRCDTIERRMARMYIETKPEAHMGAGLVYNPDLRAPPMSAAQSTASDTSYTYTAGSTSPVSRHTILPQYAVEEPVSPEFQSNSPLAPVGGQTDESAIVDVRMKGAEPAWYEREKDRIVITDLDEAVAEAEEEYKSEAEPHPDAAEYADSNADYSISSVLLDHIKRQSNFPYVPQNKKEEKSALVLFKPSPTSFFAAPTSDENAQKGDDVQVEEIDASEARAFTPSGDFTLGAVSMDHGDDGAGEPMDMDMDVEL